jgi:biopolymer transport protein ExbD
VHFRRSGKHHTEASTRLPLTAFIDVVLFLLLYFMLAGNLAMAESELSSGLKSEKQSGSKSADLTPQVVEVRLEDGRAVFRLGERQMTERSALTEVLRLLPKGNGVFVKVSGQAPVSAAAAALQACRDAGFAKISYVPSK